MVLEVVKKSNVSAIVSIANLYSNDILQLNYYVSQGFKVVGKGIYIKRRPFEGAGEPLGPDPEGDISEGGRIGRFWRLRRLAQESYWVSALDTEEGSCTVDWK